MAGGRPLGRRFGRARSAYAVSAYGTGLGLGAFSMIAVLVLHSGPTQVAVPAAAGRPVGAVPLGPWVEFRRKRPIVVETDLLSVSVAYWLGRLSFARLLVVPIVVAAADIAFNAACGAYLKRLLPPEDLLVANDRFESTTWSVMMAGPPLGGSVIADARRHLLSALGIRAIGGTTAPWGRRPP